MDSLDNLPEAKTVLSPKEEASLARLFQDEPSGAPSAEGPPGPPSAWQVWTRWSICAAGVTWTVEVETTQWLSAPIPLKVDIDVCEGSWAVKKDWSKITLTEKTEPVKLEDVIEWE